LIYKHIIIADIKPLHAIISYIVVAMHEKFTMAVCPSYAVIED